MLVKIDESLKDLVKEHLCLLLRQGLVTLSLHILLEIKLQILEHEIELVLTVDNLLQSISQQITRVSLYFSFIIMNAWYLLDDVRVLESF